jgi:hypothetical protein
LTYTGRLEMVARLAVLLLGLAIGLAMTIPAVAEVRREEAARTRADEDAYDIVAVDEDDDDATGDTDDTGKSGGTKTSGENSKDGTNSAHTGVSKDRDRSRGDRTKDRTRDGAGGSTRDHSRNHTNDKSRNDTR